MESSIHGGIERDENSKSERQTVIDREMESPIYGGIERDEESNPRREK